MRVLNLLLLFHRSHHRDAVYHPSSLFQHRGTRVLLSSEADDAEAEEPVAADPPAPAAAADGGGVDGKLVVQGAAVAAMGAALYFEPAGADVRWADVGLGREVRQSDRRDWENLPHRGKAQRATWTCRAPTKGANETPAGNFVFSMTLAAISRPVGIW